MSFFSIILALYLLLKPNQSEELLLLEWEDYQPCRENVLQSSFTLDNFTLILDVRVKGPSSLGYSDILHISGDLDKSTYNKRECYDERLPFIWFNQQKKAFQFDIAANSLYNGILSDKIEYNRWYHIEIQWLNSKIRIFVDYKQIYSFVNIISSVTGEKQLQIPSACNYQRKVAAFNGFVRNVHLYTGDDNTKYLEETYPTRCDASILRQIEKDNVFTLTGFDEVKVTGDNLTTLVNEYMVFQMDNFNTKIELRDSNMSRVYYTVSFSQKLVVYRNEIIFTVINGQNSSNVTMTKLKEFDLMHYQKIDQFVYVHVIWQDSRLKVSFNKLYDCPLNDNDVMNMFSTPFVVDLDDSPSNQFDSLSLISSHDVFNPMSITFFALKPLLEKVTAKMNWLDANAYCSTRGQNLFVPNNECELEHLKEMHKNDDELVWLNAVRKMNTSDDEMNEEDWYASLDGEQVRLSYYNWAVDEPRSAAGNANDEYLCVEILADGTWRTSRCVNHRTFYCQSNYVPQWYCAQPAMGYSLYGARMSGAKILDGEVLPYAKVGDELQLKYNDVKEKVKDWIGGIKDATHGRQDAKTNTLVMTSDDEEFLDGHSKYGAKNIDADYSYDSDEHGEHEQKGYYYYRVHHRHTAWAIFWNLMTIFIVIFLVVLCLVWCVGLIKTPN